MVVYGNDFPEFSNKILLAHNFQVGKELYFLIMCLAISLAFHVLPVPGGPYKIKLGFNFKALSKVSSVTASNSSSSNVKVFPFIAFS